MKIYPLFVKRTTIIAGGDADIVWGEPLKLTDKISPTLKFPEALKFRDQMVPGTLKLTTDTLRFTSARVVPAVTASYPEPLKLRDGFIGHIDELKVARTGTPDGDHLGDAWTDGVPLNNGVNHGNETPLPTSGNLLSATTTFPYFKWTLATPRFTGIAHRTGVGVARFSFWAQQGLAVVQALNIIFWPLASSFTESTINFTNQPVPPTVGTGGRVDRAINILVGAVNGRYDIDFTAAEFAPFIGNWMLIRMDSAAVLATAINVVSREGAAAERPLLSFDFKNA